MPDDDNLIPEPGNPGHLIDKTKALARDYNKINKRWYAFSRKGETIAEFEIRTAAGVKKASQASGRARTARKEKKEADAAAKRKREREKNKRAEAALERAVQGMETRSAGEVDLVTDILWVYEHLKVKPSKWKDAPGPGALRMLQWAHEDPKYFYNTMVVKALAMQQEREREGRGVGGNGGGKVVDKSLADVRRLLREFAGKEVDDHESPEGRQAQDGSCVRA